MPTIECPMIGYKSLAVTASDHQAARNGVNPPELIDKVYIDYSGGYSFGYVCRSVLCFDTSDVPQDMTITSVKMQAIGYTKHTATHIAKFNWQPDDPITDDNSQRVFRELLMSEVEESLLTENKDYFDFMFYRFTSGKLSKDWINKGGNTYYGLLSRADFYNMTPSPYDTNATFYDSAVPFWDVLPKLLVECRLVTPTPDCRRLTIPREDRRLTIHAEDRTLTIPREDRTLRIKCCE